MLRSASSQCLQWLVQLWQKLLSGCTPTTVLPLFWRLWTFLRRLANRKTLHQTYRKGPRGSSIDSAAFRSLASNKEDFINPRSGRADGGVFFSRLPDKPISFNVSAVPLAVLPNDREETGVQPSHTETPNSPPLAYFLESRPPLTASGLSASSTIRVSSTPSPQTLHSGSSTSYHELAIPTSTQSAPISSNNRWRQHLLVPISHIERYDRKILIPKRDPNDEIIITPMTTEFKREDIIPGWAPLVHPEGSIYFFNEKRRIYTDAHLYEPDVLEEVEACAKRIFNSAKSKSFLIPSGADLVIELQQDEDDSYWYYYFVQHETRSLFWLHEHNMTYELSETRGQISPAHLTGVFLNVDFRTHITYFPHGHYISNDIFKELGGILLWAMTDQITSQTSLVSYSADDVHRMLSIAEKARELGDTDYCATIVGRLMGIFVSARLLHYYGEYGARLDYKQSVHGATKPQRSFLISAFSPLLFNAPMVHLHGLEDVWIDEMMTQRPWAQLIEKLKDEWQDYVLLATVLLNANVAFLAIPNVINEDDSTQSTPAQVVSYISVVASIGSIVIGLLLLRQYRVKPRDNLSEALMFLQRHMHPTRGIETLAVLYSLPYALLMWGMISFLVAFCAQSFSIRDVFAVIVVAIIWAILVALIVWCIYSAWEDIDTLLPRAMRRLCTDVTNLRRSFLKLARQALQRPTEQQYKSSA